jgi:hypothetical protein
MPEVTDPRSCRELRRVTSAATVELRLGQGRAMRSSPFMRACTARGAEMRPHPLSQERRMNDEQAQANLQLALDWIEAMRCAEIDAIA